MEPQLNDLITALQALSALVELDADDPSPHTRRTAATLGRRFSELFTRLQYPAGMPLDITLRADARSAPDPNLLHVIEHAARACGTIAPSQCPPAGRANADRFIVLAARLKQIGDEEHAKVAIGPERQSTIEYFELAPPEPANALNTNEFAVLQYLGQKYPQLCTLDDLDGPPVNLSRKTAGKIIYALIEAGLACRPQGDRCGATVTERGLAVGRDALITH